MTQELQYAGQDSKLHRHAKLHENISHATKRVDLKKKKDTAHAVQDLWLERETWIKENAELSQTALLTVMDAAP